MLANSYKLCMALNIVRVVLFSYTKVVNTIVYYILYAVSLGLYL